MKMGRKICGGFWEKKYLVKIFLLFINYFIGMGLI